MNWNDSPWGFALFIAGLLIIYLMSTQYWLRYLRSTVSFKLNALILFISTTILFCLITFFLFLNMTGLFGIKLYEVASQSMHPTLKDGEIILVNTKGINPKILQHNDIIVFIDKTSKDVNVKRISQAPQHLQTTKKSGIYVLGDNPWKSYDSRYHGLIEPKQIIGKVISKFDISKLHKLENWRTYLAGF